MNAIDPYLSTLGTASTLRRNRTGFVDRSAGRCRRLADVALRCGAYGGLARSVAAKVDSDVVVHLHASRVRIDDPLNEDLMPYYPAFEPVVADNRLFLGFNDTNKVVAFDASTGRSLWTYYTDGPVRILPVVHRQRVYFTSDDGLEDCFTERTQPVFGFDSAGQRQHGNLNAQMFARRVADKLGDCISLSFGNQIELAEDDDDTGRRPFCISEKLSVLRRERTLGTDNHDGNSHVWQPIARRVNVVRKHAPQTRRMD